MLAFLGWNPGTDQEVFGMPELINAFSLDRVGRSGAKYDFSKTKWFNQQHLRKQTNQKIFEEVIKINDNIISDSSKEYIVRVIDLVKERAVFYNDILEEGQVFFSDNIQFDKKAINKKWKQEFVPHLVELSNRLIDLDSFKDKDIEEAFNLYLDFSDMSTGKIMPMLRIAITGRLAGPSMFEALELIGKEKMKMRIDFAVNTI
tara:strand:- start:28 stop:636 length:609 start_codon:yes stop_codon:yes gene_type:complete